MSLRLPSSLAYALAGATVAVVVRQLLERLRQADPPPGEVDEGGATEHGRNTEELDRRILELERQLAALRSAKTESAGVQPGKGDATAMCHPVPSKGARSHTTIASRHVTVGRKLGAGSFGAVYQGSFRGIDVALKFVTSQLRQRKSSCGNATSSTRWHTRT